MTGPVVVLGAGAVAGLGLLLVVLGAVSRPSLAQRLAAADAAARAARRPTPLAQGGRRLRWGQAAADAFLERGWASAGLRAGPGVWWSAPPRSTSPASSQPVVWRAGGGADGGPGGGRGRRRCAAAGAGVVHGAGRRGRVRAAGPAGALSCRLPGGRTSGVVVGAFLELVAMRMAGGAGLAEAVREAATVGDGWGVLSDPRGGRGGAADGRDAGDRRLERLGTELGLADLADLGRNLTLVEDSGVAMRDTLTARAASLREPGACPRRWGRRGRRASRWSWPRRCWVPASWCSLGYPAVARVLAA